MPGRPARDRGARRSTSPGARWSAARRRARPSSSLPGVKNIIAVASGKGGVGKSTVSVNLAVALAQAGASVGLLDADITGPNIPMMIGVEGQPKASAEQQDHPARALRREDASRSSSSSRRASRSSGAARWSAARSSSSCATSTGASSTTSSIDLPPGTSDAQLTLAQAVPLGGAVLVTTPQEVASATSTRRSRCSSACRVPILGVVENMTAFVCPHCGELTEIFGRGGGERFAASMASTTSAACRSTSRSARAATSACRPSPSASRAPRRGR